MNWDTDKKGNITLAPLLGYDTALFAKTVCGLRVTFARDETSFGAGGEHLQLALNPKQALDLAQALRTAAQKAMQTPGGHSS